MPVFNTPPTQVIGASAGTWVPMTGPLSSAQFGDVRFRVWTDGVLPTDGSTRCYPCAQFSVDGQSWTSSVVAFTGYDQSTAPKNSEWDNSTFKEWKNVFDLTAPSLYVRFGMVCKSNGGPNYAGRMILSIESKPLWSRTLTTPQFVANCLLATGSGGDTFTPATEWIPIADVTHARYTYELVSSTGEIEILPAFQTADSDTVGTASQWTVPTGLTARSTVGVTTGSLFTALFPTGLETESKRRMIRFGVCARNTVSSGAVNESAVVRLRVDVRDREK